MDGEAGPMTRADWDRLLAAGLMKEMHSATATTIVCAHCDFRLDRGQGCARKITIQDRTEAMRHAVYEHDAAFWKALGEAGPRA
jgi:hypothetical protein